MEIQIKVAPPDVTGMKNESVYGTHLRMLSKFNLKVHMDAKSGPLRNESKSCTWWYNLGCT